MIDKKIASDILQTLGYEALKTIEEGSPQLIDCVEFQVLQFWYRGQECEYYPFTEPVLLRQVETDKEFPNFTVLMEEINGSVLSPAA